MTDSTGIAQTSYTFEPFGNATVAGSASSNSFAYTGRELDASGLQFNRARYYHPQLQRFISEDPIGFRGGINGYAYVSNSPTNFFDPLGLDKKGPLDRAKDTARCAASVSQAGSLHNLFGVPELVGSNFFGDVAGAVLGPEPETDSTTATNARIDQGLNAAADLSVHAAVAVAPQVAIGTVTSIGMPVSYAAGVYNPVTVGEATATLGGTVEGAAAISAAELLLGAKIGLDGLVYLEALAVCSIN